MKEIFITRNFRIGKNHFFRCFKKESVILYSVFHEKPEGRDIIPSEIPLYGRSLKTYKKKDGVIPDKIEYQVKYISGPFLKKDYKIFYQKVSEGVFKTELKLFQSGVWQIQEKIFYKNETVLEKLSGRAYIIADPPQIADMKVYSYIPKQSGTIEDWITDLPRLKNMGINTVHLLPITRTGKSQSPYSAADLFNIDESFMIKKKFSSDQKAGTDEIVKSENEGIRLFKKYVHALKKHGIRLCVDLVFNHTASDSPLINRHPEWYQQDDDEDDFVKRSGWDDGQTFHKWEDLALLDYDTPHVKERKALWRYMYKYIYFWAREAAKTGGMIRLDNLHSSHPEFTREVLTKLKSRFPDLIFLGEMFEQEDQIIKMSFHYGLNLLLATPWEHKFVPQLRDYIRYLHRMGARLRYLFPITSHDSMTPAEEFGSVKATIPRFAASCFLGSGPSGLVQGVEYGLEKKIPFIGPAEKIDFAAVGRENFSAMIARFYEITDQNPCFQRPGNLLFIDRDHDAVMAAGRRPFFTDSHVSGYLIICNFDIYHNQSLSISKEAIIQATSQNPEKENKAREGQELLLTDLLSNKTITVYDHFRFDLNPCEVMVYELKNHSIIY